MKWVSARIGISVAAVLLLAPALALPTGATPLRPSTGVGSVTNHPIEANLMLAPGSSRTLTVKSAEAPTVTSRTTTTFVKGRKGTFTVRATGNPAAMTFTKTGTLPGGVSFTSAGVLSGAPKVTGSFTIIVSASNGVLPNAVQTFTLRVVAIEITTLTLGTARRGAPYSLQLTAIGGTPRYSWINTTPLPAGLQMRGVGYIGVKVRAGAATGTYSVVISVHDGALPTPNTARAVLKLVVT